MFIEQEYSMFKSEFALSGIIFINHLDLANQREHADGTRVGADHLIRSEPFLSSSSSSTE